MDENSWNSFVSSIDNLHEAIADKFNGLFRLFIQSLTKIVNRTTDIIIAITPPSDPDIR